MRVARELIWVVSWCVGTLGLCPSGGMYLNMVRVGTGLGAADIGTMSQRDI